MLKLNFPPFEYKTKKIQDSLYILDRIRKKYVSLTPEEWVRQHTVNYLIEILKYPKSKILIEKQIQKSNFIFRYDILVTHDIENTILLVECKSPMQQVDKKSIEQLMKYNKYLNSKYLFLTNGITHHIFSYNKNLDVYEKISELPSFGEVVL